MLGARPPGDRRRVQPGHARPRKPTRTAIAAYLTNQAQLRGLSAIELDPRATAPRSSRARRAPISTSPPPPPNDLQQADGGEPALIAPGTTNLVGGVDQAGQSRRRLPLSRAADRSAGHALPSADARRMRRNTSSSRRTASACRSPSRILFAGIALVVLLSAIWIGLGFANRPCRADPAADRRGRRGLGRQSRRARAGGAARPATSRRWPTTFNTMTGQLKSQRDELLAGERGDRRAPALHRGGAVRRLGRRHRPRRATGA